MGKPGRIHHIATVLFIGLIVGALALAAVRYVEYGQARKLGAYQVVSAALQLATGVRNPEELEADVSAQAPVLFSQQARRTFFVQKGKRVEALNISRPARVVVDLAPSPAQKSRPAGEVSDDDKAARDRLVALTARLEQYFREGGQGIDLHVGGLFWPRPGEPGVLVGTWPAFSNNEFVGIAAVEMPAVSHGGTLIWGALALLAGAGLLFVLLSRLTSQPRMAFAGAGLLVLLAASLMLTAYNDAQLQRFAAARETSTQAFVNATAWSNPQALEMLDGVWEKIFKVPATGLRIAPVADSGPFGAFEVAESVESFQDLVRGRTVPIVLIVLFGLALGFAVFNGLAGVLWGLARMPGVYAYIAPAMLGMLVLVLIPFLMGVGLGFFNTDYEFVGFENFRDILFPSAESDTNFYFTLGVTVLWTVANVALHVTIGLALALVLVSNKVRFRGVFRVLLIVPWAIPNYITALIWKWMFTAELGAINLMLSAVGFDNPPNWFGPSFWTNFFAVLATNTWLGFPFMMVVSMGALQSIPADLYEAADIDGASRWQKFRNITLPLLKPALFPAIILGSIWTFNMFNIIYLVTRGAPDNKTNILITEAFRFFHELNQYGVAAAYCVLIFVILLMYTLITNRVTRATAGAFE